MLTSIQWLGVLALLVGTTAARADTSVGPAAGGAALVVLTDGEHPAGRAVLLRIALTNQLPHAIHYWCGGPGIYPSAHEFHAVLRDSAGRERSQPLWNGQYTQGSGSDRAILPGATVEVPALFPSPEPGDYLLRVVSDEGSYVDKATHRKVIAWPAATSAPVAIRVRADSALERRLDQTIVSRVAGGDQFAIHAAADPRVAELRDPASGSWDPGSARSRTVSSDTIRSGLLATLLSDDPQAVAAAASALQRVDRAAPPPGVGTTLRRCYERWSSPSTIARRPYDLTYPLAIIASHVGDDDAKALLLAMAHDPIDGARQEAARYSRRFVRDERFTRMLHELLADLHPPARGEAAVALAQTADPGALPVLLEFAEPKFSYRGHAWNVAEALTHYRDARAVAAVEKMSRGEEGSDYRDVLARRAAWPIAVPADLPY
jgi:hypothetical protein